MNTPTHQEITQRAHQLWEEAGQPVGRDLDIWLEAERQAAAGLTRVHATGLTSPQHPLTDSPPDPAAVRDLEARQKRDARAPRQAATHGHRAAPPESGKPLYDRPHSS